MTYKSGFLIAAACSVVVLLSACSKTEVAPEPVRAVRIVTVAADQIQTQREFAGEVRARVESNLGFRVAGKVIRRAVELGQTVQAGQVLAQLDPQDYKLQTEAAKAQLQAAQVNLDLALADLKRYRELRAQNFISSAELDKHEGTYKSAQASWDQAKAQLNSQSNQVGYTTLVADAPGVVTLVSVEVGQVVAAGATVVQVAQQGAREVVFAVPEDWVGRIRVGSTLTAKLWNSTDEVKATVREVAASADSVTRTFTVRATLPAQANWALGTTASVMPIVAADAAAPAVIKLPTSALLQSGGKTVVWVLDKSTMAVHQKPVQVQGADGNSVVLKEGLQPGQQVVIAGVHVLTEGEKVTIYQESGKP
ncbi:efflux RND transporter periplasmic adaptor subunit [Curvibacter sp. CHRR-16]|uniref:efflux RND transporter periplasmic adaptor subunit n=1 Tax=Curvibacter sp. CHRR-16 TaxID=2835872 RepID=UPI001BD946D6|nr:efflux RND transporter periplasmic adaptor subunit [Curvibacter sp. CHRR-16]MBT0569269.1 efflux RND transporter periplasmic adaptor subunit [Curvibacter sp. CHRR-16]